MRARLFGAIVVAGALASCSVPAPVPVRVAGEGQQPTGFPEAYYLEAARRGAAVYAIDPKSSLVVIEVRRAGTLAQLGHDHVVASHDTRGYVAPADGRAIFTSGSTSSPSTSAISARRRSSSRSRPTMRSLETRDNMLRKLDADVHPYAIIGVRGVDNDATGSWLNATLAVSGTERAVRIPARIAATPAEVDVSGQLEVQQTSFGITPYSILAGALQVKDEVAIRFRIHARRLAM
jgi:polyisoprenoid-binding protein YceI